ncbi:hypothetical protein [Luteolibacter soli]|uniref:Uncharacterized protein n=1 Tax=Luteolibacter soli TaxID=3135280 RepID=A0ABU9AWC9_9BACT
MSWLESKLEFQIGSTANGLVRAIFRHPGRLPMELATIVKPAGESWEDEPCEPLSGPTCWLYGLLFGLKWRSLAPVFTLRSTMANGHLIRFFQGQDRRGRSKFLVLADDRQEGGSVFTVSEENFANVRRELDQWRQGLAGQQKHDVTPA